MTSDLGVLSHHPPQRLRPFDEAAALSHQLAVSFSVERYRDRLSLSFVFSGRGPADLQRLVFPAVLEPSARLRRDELWKNTCLEIFVGPADASTYYELNLSPSGHWNIYAFDSYRQGMREAEGAHAPLVQVETSLSGDHLIFRAELKAQPTPPGEKSGEIGDLLQSRALVMNATAVLEYGTGEREYWALVHAGEKPDFHLHESFRLRL